MLIDLIVQHIGAHPDGFVVAVMVVPSPFPAIGQQVFIAIQVKVGRFHGTIMVIAVDLVGDELAARAVEDEYGRIQQHDIVAAAPIDVRHPDVAIPVVSALPPHRIGKLSVALVIHIKPIDMVSGNVGESSYRDIVQPVPAEIAMGILVAGMQGKITHKGKDHGSGKIAVVIKLKLEGSHRIATLAAKHGDVVTALVVQLAACRQDHGAGDDDLIGGKSAVAVVLQIADPTVGVDDDILMAIIIQIAAIDHPAVLGHGVIDGAQGDRADQDHSQQQ